MLMRSLYLECMILLFAEEQKEMWLLASEWLATPAIIGHNHILAVALPQISDKHVYDSTLSLIKTKPNEMQMKQKILISACNAPLRIAL